ncbi:MAG: hypothetical protein OPY06_02770 [Nitrosopumilus sp.]|nr:hypothetical protein [Nitrosopumilus sp.]MDF2426436.1 hypothetical protein [Nitrosopumilus sp.]MDF2429038.1 hypothetical protein [Nitrosopumilus sp.]
MLYNFELQMLGAILLPAMLAGCVFLWLKRRKANHAAADAENEDSSNI